MEKCTPNSAIRLTLLTYRKVDGVPIIEKNNVDLVVAEGAPAAKDENHACNGRRLLCGQRPVDVLPE